MRLTTPLLKAVNKISIIVDGAIGRQTLFSILRTFPPIKDLEIVFFNRTYEKVLGYSDDLTIGGLDTDYLDKWHKNSQSADISIIPTSNEADIADSKVVIFTAGISATLFNSKTREVTLPVAHKMIKHFGKAIKHHAPKSTIFMITNPVDIATQLMSEETGFESRRVIGSGTELGGRRFGRYFFTELKDRGFGDVKKTKSSYRGEFSR